MGHSNKLTLPGIPKITHVKLSINFLNRTRKVVDTNWLGSLSDHRNTQSLDLTKLWENTGIFTSIGVNRVVVYIDCNVYQNILLFFSKLFEYGHLKSLNWKGKQ